MAAGKKSQSKRININFRQTKSERTATNSYRGFGKYFKTKFNKFNKFNKFIKF